MNWLCLVEALMAYLACVGRKGGSAAQAKIIDCLVHAAQVGVAAAIPAFLECVTQDGEGNGDGDADGPGNDYRPGDRIRCPTSTS